MLQNQQIELHQLFCIISAQEELNNWTPSLSQCFQASKWLPESQSFATQTKDDYGYRNVTVQANVIIRGADIRREIACLKTK